MKKQSEGLASGLKGGPCYSKTETSRDWLPLLPHTATSPGSFLTQRPHLVVGQGVQSLPVILDLGGDVLILQDHPRPASLSPLCGKSPGSSERPSGPSWGWGVLKTAVQAPTAHPLKGHPWTDSC